MPIGLDASLPLRIDDTESFYVLNQTIKDNIKQKVKMLLLTAPGERVMVPRYGCGIRHFLFENANSDVEIDLVETIQEQFGRYLNDVEIVSLDISHGDHKTFAVTGKENSLIVSLTYQIKGTNLVDAIKLVETQKP